MAANNLLSRLDVVKQTGARRWIARCPAHDDEHPSLSIRECDDSRLLLKCWAGCDVASILDAVGLTWAAIMPPAAIGHHTKPERKPFHPGDILQCTAFETLLVSVAAAAIARGENLTDSDRQRLQVASARLSAAAEIGGAS